MERETGRGAGQRGPRRGRWLAAIVVASAVILGGGMFTLARQVNERDQLHLLNSQAQDARITITALFGELESTMSSVGSVEAATSGDPGAVNRLATTDPVVQIFSSLAVLHRSPGGPLTVVVQRGSPSAPLPALVGTSGQELAQVAAHGGVDIIGLFGHGAQRRLALAQGAPLVPGGYVVYAEIPLPQGTTDKSGFPRLQWALYDGRSTTAPLLLATTKALPLSGERVSLPVDLNNLDTTVSPKSSEADVLFVVSASGSLVGILPDLLPWILGTLAIVFGLLVAFVLEVTSRRKDQALFLVAELEDKNESLDRAIAEQVKAEQDRIRLEGELRQSQRLESVGRLAGGVAHDFNNLLAAILTYSEFIAEDLGPDHPAQGDIAEVRKAARRATDLTRQLLVFSRRDLVKASVLDVNEAITDLLNLLQRTLGEDIVLHPVLSSGLLARIWPIPEN